MHETEPKVRLLAAPAIRWSVVEEYLTEVGGTAWLDRVKPPIGQNRYELDRNGPPPPGSRRWSSDVSDAELLVEFAGRRCYRSWVPGLNANVTKVREDSGVYLGNILSSKHGAVLEHAQFTFDFDNVSRVFTHELVRHRAGVAISQESLRYVRLTDLGFRIPDILANGPDTKQQSGMGAYWEDGDPMPMRDAVISIVEHLEEFQRSAAEAFGLDDEGTPFHVKKEVTSALRRLAPLGLSTGMVWSANLRTLRHLLQLRTATSAEEEIRMVFDQVGAIMMQECPLLFQDFSVDDDGQWVPEHEKV